MTSIRAASYSRWSQQYVGADFIGGIVLFWLVALICYRVVWDDEHATEVRITSCANEEVASGSRTEAVKKTAR
jgi:hypothetical protein